MATRFVRVDLSDVARDFRPIAIEPGVPLLDRSGANAKILFRWLGGLIAEPVWEEESVHFFVRDDHGGRLEEVVCQTASADDLAGPLKPDLNAIRQRLESVRPETSTERALLKCVLQSLRDVVDNPNRTDLDDYFFRYRDASGRWRLVWCWGYQRVDQEPAPAVICTDPDCALLFVRRPGQSPKCPSCSAALALKPARRRSGRRLALALLLLLLLLGLLAYWMYLRRQAAGLRVEPDQLALCVGQVAELRIAARSQEPIVVASNAPQIVAVADSPERSAPEAAGGEGQAPTAVQRRVVARAEGEARIEVIQGAARRTVEVVVSPAALKSLALEPARLVVPVGESARPRLFGTLEDGRRVELAPEMATTERVPSPRYVQFDPRNFALRGVEPTPPGAPQSLGLRFGGQSAAAPVEVVSGSRPADSLGPVAVKILSDQGPRVRTAVGAEFDDFRVEAHYADGFTQLVTTKATLRTPELPDQSPVAPSAGRLVAVRPGTTRVSAEFEGVASKESLEVEVLDRLDIDELRLTPSPARMLRGETLHMEATGYKQGRSVGILSAMPGMSWTSDRPEVVQAAGPVLSAAGLGSARVSAMLGSVKSSPAEVEVVDTIGEALVADPPALRIGVGQAVQLGVDLKVYRGQVELSRQCRVTPALDAVVRYDPISRSLVGVSPGGSAVALAAGDQLTNVVVEVVAAPRAVDGEVVVEPAAAALAVGQALPLRVFVAAPGAARADRTESAVLTSSDPSVARVVGQRVCAVGPGSATITAQLPETTKNAAASILVTADPITAIRIDPPRLDLSVGQKAPMRILGESAAGVHELYPQPDLNVAPAGAQPKSIRLAGSNVEAVAPGQAAIAARWRDLPEVTAPVSVTDDPWKDLRIEPAQAKVLPGHPLVYQVTARRGAQRYVVTPDDGLQVFASDARVAESLGGTAVRGTAPGRTSVVAQLGSQRAESVLDVVLPAAGDVAAVGPGGVGVIDGTSYGYTVRPGYWRDGRWYAGWDGDYVDDGALLVPGADVRVPLAATDGLAFVPDVARLPSGSPGTTVRVVERLADGSLGRDVSNDPALELTDPRGIVSLEKTPAGVVVRPLQPGEARVGARLGTLTADPLLVSVGDYLAVGRRLEVMPDPLVVWVDELGSFGAVRVYPGEALAPIDVDYRITAPEAQGVVAVESQRRVRGLAPGAAELGIVVVDPSGGYDGLSTTARVQVIAPDRLTIVPASLALQVGQATPPLAVWAEGSDGVPRRVPAVLESSDPTILAADDQLPDRFVARGVGSTQIRALYGGREAVAEVRIGGKWFVNVDTALNAGRDDFDVTITVLAEAAEGPLEYRVYEAGAAPPGPWVAAQAAAGGQGVELRSPRLRYGGPERLYQLIIEARAAGGEAVERYPLTFRLRPGIERVEPSASSPSAPASSSAPPSAAPSSAAPAGSPSGSPRF